MKLNNQIRLITIFSVIASVLFVLGCISSSYQSAETLEPKQVGIGGGYLRAENMDNSDADPLELLDLNLRYGIARGFDMGLAHTFDISSQEGDNTLSTVWMDMKGQLSNRDNIPGHVSFSLGLIKGYTYDYETHITSLPVRLSVPLDEHITPTLQYRITFLSDDFVPSSVDNPRHEVTLGMEYSFNNHSTDSWNPKIGFAVGTFNSLAGGEGDRGLILNLGFTIESPVRF